MQLRMIAHPACRWRGKRHDACSCPMIHSTRLSSWQASRRFVTWQPYPGVVSPQFRIGSDACAMWQAIRLRRGLSTRESPQCENGGHGGPLFFFVVLLRPSKLSHVVLFQYPIRDKILKPVTCLKLSGLSGKVKRERIMTSEWRLSWFCGFNCTLRFAGTQKISPANGRSDS